MSDRCRHIYDSVGEELCAECGGHTHEIDWAYQAQLHEEWIASGKVTHQGWWSI